MTDNDKRARELLADAVRAIYPDDASTRYVITQLERDHLDMISMPAALQAITAALREGCQDKARLDWLADRNNQIGNVQLPTMCVMNNMQDMRAAIDEAMQIDPEAWEVVAAADDGEVASDDDAARPQGVKE